MKAALSHRAPATAWPSLRALDTSRDGWRSVLRALLAIAMLAMLVAPTDTSSAALAAATGETTESTDQGDLVVLPDGPPSGFVPGIDDVPQPGEEILGHTPFTRWWRKAGGTIGFESFVHQQFFQTADGAWVDVDPTLVEGPDGLVARALPGGSAKLTSSLSPDSPAITLGDSLHAITVRFPGVNAAVAELDEVTDVARYADAFGSGADLILDVAPFGWKDSIDLDQAGIAGYEVRFTVPAGTVARNLPIGGVEFTDLTGRRLLTYGVGAVAYDSTVPVVDESPVSATLVRQTATEVVVRVQADPAWIDAAERVFPVTIDPMGYYDFRHTWTSECSTSPSTFDPCDTYGNSDAPSGAWWQQTQLRVGSAGNQEAGSPPGTTSRTRTFVKFPTDNIGSGSYKYTVATAMVSLYAYEAGSTNSYTDHLYELLSSPTSATTWSNQPTWGDAEASDAAGGVGYRQWYPTALVNRWFRGTQTNHGVGIQTCCDEHSTARLKKFYSAQAWGVTNTTSARQPRLYVEYYEYPSNPGTPSVTAGAGSVTATWAASSDDGGGTITYEVQRRSVGGSWGGTTTVCETCTRSVTFTGLTNGQAYEVRVRATNQTGPSSWITSAAATPDGTNPTTPSVASSTHPSQNAWSTSDDPCFSWSASDPETGITGYSRLIDQSPTTTPNTSSNGTGTSYCASNLADGEWWFHVRARNGRTNNNMWGAAAHYRVRIDDTAAAAPGVSSSTHPEQSAWYAADDVTLSWSASDTSGIDGYSWVLDQVSGTVPDTTSEGTSTTVDYTDLADGVWYFHVRARNGSGLWSNTTHYTIRIDASAPPVPMITSSTHPDQNVWSTNNDPAFSWSVSDTSGIDGYSYNTVLDQSPSTVPDEVSEGMATSLSFTDQADGEWWLHVRARNGSGLWSATGHYRVRIDSGPPPAPVITSASHPDQDIWYADNDPVAAWSSSDPNGISGYSWVWDQAATTVPDTVSEGMATGLSRTDEADGIWWLHVRALDGAGKWSTTGHYRFRIDATAPTNLSVSSSTHPNQNTWYPADDVTLSWSATDTSGIAGYSWVWDQTATTTPDQLSEGTATTTSLPDQPDGEWWLHVRAVNGSGQWATTVHYRVRIDDTAPAAPVVSSSTHPEQSAWYPADDVTLSWSASDTSGIDGYSWVLDQTAATTPDTVSEGTATTTSYADLADGVWYFHVRARNGSGLWSATTHYTVRIDDTAPTDLSVSSSTHPNQNTWYPADDVTLSWSATDTSGIAGYSWVWDQTATTTADQVSEGTATTASLTDQPDGEWWLHVRAVNGSGQWGQTVHYRVRIDDTAAAAPVVSSSTHPEQEAWYPADDVDVSWSASDTSGIDGYSWVLDQTAATTPDTTSEGTATSTSSTGLADGVWYFHVRARNGSGLWSDTTHYTIRIDATAPTAPTITSTTHPDQNVWSTNNDPAWMWESSSASGIAGYSFVLDQQPSTVPTGAPAQVASHAATDLADGWWWLHVRAINDAGQWSGTSHYRVTIDTTAPAAGTVASSTHPDQDLWYSNSDPAFTWTFSDTAPITGYSIMFDQADATIPDDTVDTTTSSRTYPQVADGVWWFHVRARNASGLWSPPVHYRVRVDVTAPAAPAVVSTTHPNPESWYSHNDPQLMWAASDTSGIAGYSWLLDDTADTEPDDVLEDTATQAAFTDVEDGEYWFHVRARNGSGLWSATTHFRIRIDTTPPPTPLAYLVAYSPTNLFGQWLSTDTGSGLAGYSYHFGTSPALPDGTPDTTETFRTWTVVEPGTYHLSVVAVDLAGNVSGTASDSADTSNPLDGMPEPGTWPLAFEQISAGLAHTCGLTEAGDVYCWGLNTDGQLGDGSTTGASTPVKVGGLSAMTQVDAGYAHTCARSEGGQVWCWGRNDAGQLGDGTSTSRSSPVLVTGLTAATQISAGGGHTCAVTLTGGVSCWGDNFAYQLGDGTQIDRAAPVQVAELSGGADAVTAGFGHTCVTSATGVRCWGDNSFGQLGQPGVPYLEHPGVVAGVASGPVSAGFGHTCVTTAGQLHCWGSNSHGQLGDGTTTSRATPQAVALAGVQHVDASYRHTCATVSSGGAYCWGANADGQLGNGTTTASTTPVAVLGLSQTTVVTLGHWHTCALDDAETYCWGRNNHGQLGNGTTSPSATPLRVDPPFGARPI